MKNIAILVPSLKKGGAEKQAALLARALSEYGFNVCMIIPFADTAIEEENRQLCNLHDNNIIAFRGKEQGSLIKLYKTLRDRKTDILFCYLTWPDFYGPLIGRIAGVKQIFQGLRNAQLPIAKLVLEFIGNRFATAAITNNFAGEKIFRKYGLRNQIVIPNCYLNPQDIRVREEKETVTVITVGRFVPQKDYATAIAAFAKAYEKNPTLRFKIIGHGELENDVRRMIGSHGLTDSVEILINPPCIPGHLHDADIYLSTSLFEGTSNSIMEALDSSLPVVATDVGDNSQLVSDGINGFLTCTRDVDAIASALLSLAADRSMRNRFGAEGHRILTEKYSYSKFRQSYLNIIL